MKVTVLADTSSFSLYFIASLHSVAGYRHESGKQCSFLPYLVMFLCYFTYQGFPSIGRIKEMRINFKSITGLHIDVSIIKKMDNFTYLESIVSVDGRQCYRIYKYGNTEGKRFVCKRV